MVLAVLLVPGAVAVTAQEDVRSVLVLFSQRSTAPAVAEMEPVFRKALASADSPVDLHVEYLDLTDASGQHYETQLVALLREKYRTRQFAVLIADRAEALGLVIRHRQELFAGVPVVFTGVDEEDIRALQPPADMTGVLLNTDARGTVNLALDLHPDARRLVVVGGASQFDRDLDPVVRLQLRDRSPVPEVVSLIGQSLEQQVSAVSQLTADSVVIFTSYRVDSLGRSMVAAEVVERIANASGAPVYGSAHPWLGHGIVGGHLIRYDRIAGHGAAVANRILRGEPAASIARREEPASELMFDWRQLKRWGIDPARLPAGSAVLFREFTPFETYRWYVLGFLGVAVVQALLIGALLVQRATRRRAEAGVRAAEQRYREFADREITERTQREAELRRAVDEIANLREQLEVDNSYLVEELQLAGDLDGIVGASDALQYVLGKARQVATTSSTVLLLGETGVGKDLVATAIHNLSARRGRPLIRVNCAALPPSLIESELFGHEKGAFTGAASQRKGRFEVAHGSTLFLDEVGELPIDLQAKLLRVLQDGEFQRVGGNATITTDARIIAATNRDLRHEIKAGRFREDLWYRLNVFPITVPPLRQRREDIPLLVHHFVSKHCRRIGHPLLDVTKATMRDLQSREWVGNIRELESVVERAVITSRGATLQLTDEAGTSTAASPAGLPDAQRTLAQAERELIVATLERTGWRLEGDGGAARLLGINPSTLRSRMLKLEIRRAAQAAPRDRM